MKSKIIVIDDVLSLHDVAAFQDQHFCLENNSIPNAWADKGVVPPYFQNLVSVVEKHVDISKAVGYEWWTQKSTYSGKGWHYDLDENIWINQLKVVPPICSIVYYPLVAHMKGGDFITEDIRITPKTNRMIIMKPNVLHMIAPYNQEEATRWSFLCNPWTYKLEWANQTWTKSESGS